MNDDDIIRKLGLQAASEQNEATMQEGSRVFANQYRALINNGMPESMAEKMVRDVQYLVICKSLGLRPERPS